VPYRRSKTRPLTPGGVPCIIIHIMNDNYANKEWFYRKRWIGRSVRTAFDAFPVTVVTGARQVGKSTFLQNEFPGIRYLSLDDYPVLEQAKADPASLWAGTDQVIIDEVQKAPELLDAIKLAADNRRNEKKFILSGSSNLLLMKKVSESLAGRASYFEMLPMTSGEMAQYEIEGLNFPELWRKDLTLEERELKRVDPVPLMRTGFMPPLMFLRGEAEILMWWEGYVRTYLERDLRELSRVDSLIDFRGVMAALALRTANPLNQSDVARDTRVSQPTVYRYVNLLEVSNLVSRVLPYFPSRTKRITKSPKIYFTDPALSIYLAGYHDHESLSGARELGGFFESMVFLHLSALCGLMVPKARIHYWRTTTGKEVDFILEQGKKLLAVECKLTRKPAYGDIKNLLAFMEDHPQTLRGILLHTGTSLRYLHSKVLAVPWWWMTV